MTFDPFHPSLHGGIQHPHLSASDIDKDAGAWLIKDLGVEESLLRSIWDSVSHLTSGPTGCLACGGWKKVADMKTPKGPFVLPLPQATVPLRLEVHTLRWGDSEWMRECAPTVDAWCARHSHTLRVWKQEDVPQSYPSEKFILLDILRAFVSQNETDWVLWLDADVMVHPLAPEIVLREPGFHIMVDPPSGCTTRWPGWVQEKFGRVLASPFRYRNAGVWACDKQSATALLQIADAGPLVAGMMEQNQLNLWLSDGVESGTIKVVDLPREWNSFPGQGAAWFHHFAGAKKEHKLLQARRLGVLPDHIKTLNSPPTVPNYGKGAVVWPWKSVAAEWDELWFSVRSVQQYWQEKDWPLVLMGDRRPDWWPGEFVRAVSYEDALWAGVQCADQVLWMNDDILMLADQGLEDLQTARHFEDMLPKLGQTIASEATWRRGLGQVLMRNHHLGRTTLNFSTHTPYLFERDKAREVLEMFGCFWKMPFESAYFNWHRTPRAICREKSNGLHDLDGKLWINPAFRQVTPEFRAALCSRFGGQPAKNFP